MAKKKPKKPSAFKPKGKAPSSKKKPKKVPIVPRFDSKVVFEGTDGKFYSDQDCKAATDNLDKQMLDGWEIDKEYQNETGYPGLRKQYVLKRRNTEGEEPLGYIGMF